MDTENTTGENGPEKNLESTLEKVDEMDLSESSANKNEEKKEIETPIINSNDEIKMEEKNDEVEKEIKINDEQEKENSSQLEVIKSEEPKEEKMDNKQMDDEEKMEVDEKENKEEEKTTNTEILEKSISETETKTTTNIKDEEAKENEENVKDEQKLIEQEDMEENKINEPSNLIDESLKDKPIDKDVEDKQEENSNDKIPLIEEPDAKSPEQINEENKELTAASETKIEETTEEQINDQKLPIAEKYTVEEPLSPKELDDKADNLNNNSEEIIKIEKINNTLTDDFEGFNNSEDTPVALSILKKLISQVETEIAQNIFGEESEAELEELDEIKSFKSNLFIKPPIETPGTAKKTKVKPSYHLQKNPQFKLPFEMGWKREVIFRRTITDHRIKKSCEIVYITPDGERLHSSIEVLDHLRIKNIKTFTSSNFSFLKAPLGITEPEKEIIRRIKETSPKKKVATKASKLGTKLTISPKGASGNDEINTPNKAKGFPKIKVAAPKLTKVTTSKATTPKVITPKGSKSKATSAKKQKKSDVQAVGDTEHGVLSPNWASTDKTSPQRVKPDKKRLDPCSLRCPDGGGAIPTLQCSQCLWLYHFECVGLSASSPSKGNNYICKNCKQDKKGDSTVASPPPLTPISSLGGSPPDSKSSSPVSPPKLQRIPKSGEIISISSSATSSTTTNTTTPSTLTTSTPTTNKASKLLGAVTTWLPPASTIQLDSSKSSPPIGKTPSTSEAAQGLAKVGDRRYIVIPKHNVLSVTPTTSATAPASKPEPAPGSHTAAAAENPPGLLLVPLVAQMPPNTKDTGDQASTAKRKLIEDSSSPPSKRSRMDEQRFTEHFMSNMCLGYSGLLHVFQYLKVQDLLCAGRVCRLWRDLANHHSLWRTVRMKNSKVTDWSGLAECLRRHRTRHLDLRKMLIPAAVSSNDAESIWADFQKAISRAEALTRLDLCRCPASVVQSLGVSSPGLVTLNALAIKCPNVNLQPLAQLEHLQELRLKSVSGFELKGSLDCFKDFKSLKVLSLTTITNLGSSALENLAHLTNLESLDLGECCQFPQDFGPSILAKLVNLNRLRLEKGQGPDCPTFQILAGVQLLPQLTTLELINFDIKPGFDHALAACTNIRRILVIPTYITQSATTNHMLLSGVMKLSNTLHTFVWGVTNELLKVTELFVDQCDGGRQKGKKSDKKLGDSIPVLKPVPGSHLVNQDDEDPNTGPAAIPAAPSAEGAAAAANAQVEILPLSKLQKILLACFPNTRVKILKVPYNSTWRQTIAEPNI